MLFKCFLRCSGRKLRIEQGTTDSLLSFITILLSNGQELVEKNSLAREVKGKIWKQKVAF